MSGKFKKVVIDIKDAPKPVGPYSVAVGFAKLLFLSGQTALDETGTIIKGGVEVETRAVCENIKKILEQAGSCPKCVLKSTVFLKDMNDFAKMNAIYAEFFGGDSPARSAVQVAALPKGATVEIEVIAVRCGDDCDCDDCDCDDEGCGCNCD